MLTLFHLYSKPSSDTDEISRIGVPDKRVVGHLMHVVPGIEVFITALELIVILSFCTFAQQQYNKNELDEDTESSVN